MTKKHFLAITAAAAIVISMTGCQNSTTSSSASAGTTAATTSESAAATSAADSDSSSPEVTDALQTQEAPADQPEEVTEENSGISLPIRGADGKLISASEITTIFAMEDGVELSADELTAENWASMTCDGFTYLAVPSGYSVNSIDNADIFNETDWTFAGMPKTADISYVRVENGEEFMGYTVTNATCSFSPYINEEMGGGGFYLSSSNCNLSGSVTLTGYMNVAAEDYGYTAKRDIGFVPDANSHLIPIMKYNADAELGYVAYVDTFSNSSLVYATEYPSIYLGNADDENYGAFDFSVLPEDGSYVKAQITLSEILLASNPGWPSINAVVTDFEVLQ